MNNKQYRNIAYGLIAALALVFPIFSTGTYYIYLGIIIGIYGIVSIGLNLLSGYGGQFSLGHAAFMAMGAYTSALLSKYLVGMQMFAASGAGVWVSMIIGTLAAALFGVILALPALRVRGPYLAMVTIAFGWVVWKILQEWTSVTGGDLGISGIPRVQAGAFSFDVLVYYYFSLAWLMIALFVQYRIVYSSYGLRIKAVRHSEMASSSVGIDVYKSKIMLFVISAGFAGFGGALFAHQQSYINPDNFQFFSSVFFLLAVLFGGAGTTIGPVIGALILVLLPELLHGLDRYRLIVYGFLILLTLFYLPTGVAGLLSRKGGSRSERSISGPGATHWFDRFGGLNKGPDGVHEIHRVIGKSIRVDGIVKKFGGITALNDVSFEVGAGTIHGLIGPNGAGKTTVVNVISGIYPADSGDIRIDGAPVPKSQMHMLARLGVVRTFQNLKLFGDMTVLEHVLVGMSRKSDSGLVANVLRSSKFKREVAEQVARAKGILNFLGIRDLAYVPADSLAYGHRRLVEIARALAAEPEVLLLDEPAAGLVAEEVTALGNVISKLRDVGMTIILIEHHIDLVMKVSDRITVLDHGAVIASGTPPEVKSNAKVISAYLGVDDNAASRD